MLKGKLLIALASAVLFLGACSNEAPVQTIPETPAVEETTTETPAVEETTEEAEVEAQKVETYTLEALYDTTGEKTDVVTVSMTYENGQSTSVNIDVILEDGTLKSELAASGEYVMSQEEGALQWHEQIDAVEAFLAENNFDVTAINLTDEDGHTDSITGVSFKAGRYLELVQELMTSIENNEFTGVKTVEFKGEEGSDVVAVTFENGNPVDLTVDVIQADGSSKREASEAGTYVMGGELQFHEQMDLLQEFIVANNFDLSKVTLSDEDGHTDAVTGVSIKVGSYLPEIEEALAK